MTACRRAMRALRALLACAAPVTSAMAQPAPLRVERLAPGVYAMIRSPPATDPADPNTLVIVNDRDVIVVDANITPASARRVITEIRRLTPKPVRFVITTHYHSDHHYGNMAYRAAWPGVEFVAHVATREMVITEDIPSLRPNLDSIYPAEVRRLEGVLRSGTTAAGERLTPDQRARTEGSLRALNYFLVAARGLEMIPPTLTFTDSLVFHRGERTIVARWLGRGNTTGDVVVWLPRERIVATGDLVVAPVPYAFESFPTEWATTLATLRALPATIVLPGHGPVQRDWHYVARLTTLLCGTLTRVQAAMTPTITLDSLRERVSLADLGAALGPAYAAGRRSFSYLYETPIVERAFGEIRAAGTGWRMPSPCR